MKPEVVVDQWFTPNTPIPARQSLKLTCYYMVSAWNFADLFSVFESLKFYKDLQIHLNFRFYCPYPVWAGFWNISSHKEPMLV